MNLDLGLLILRIGIGGSVAWFHGWGKISSPAKWEQIGGAMSNLGIHFAPTVFGFLAAFSEFGAALMIAFGLYFRVATSLLGFTMFVAVLVHLNMEPGPMAGWNGASHALELLIVCVALFLSGPGKYVLALKKGSS